MDEIQDLFKSTLDPSSNLKKRIIPQSAFVPQLFAIDIISGKSREPCKILLSLLNSIESKTNMCQSSFKESEIPKSMSDTLHFLFFASVLQLADKDNDSFSIPLIPLTPFIIEDSDEDDLDRLWQKEASEELLPPNKEKSLAEDVSNFIAESNMIVETKKSDKEDVEQEDDDTLPSIASQEDNLKPSSSPESNIFTSKLMEETKKLTE